MNRPILAVGAPEGVPPAAHAVPCSTDAVVDAVRATEGDVLLAVRDTEGRRVARATRLALGAERVGILYTPSPFTAWVAAIQVLGAMPPDVELSRAAEIASALSAALHTRVVLSSVASLEKPSPTLNQHLRGALPGGRFLVDLRAGTVETFSGTLDADSPLVVVARSEKPVVDGLGNNWPEGRAEIGAVEAGWKASRWLEVTTLDEEQWYGATARLRRPGAWIPRCPACDRAGSLATCLFCDIPLSTGAPVPGDVQPVGGVPA